MVDALVSGASAARRAGSSPVLGTPKKSQVVNSQLLAIFTFTPCQRGVNRRRRNPSIQPQWMPLTRPE